MEENEKENIDTDSLSWGSASKDCVRKIYGNLEKQPKIMAMKIEIANELAEFAIGHIDGEKTLVSIESIKERYKKGD